MSEESTSPLDTLLAKRASGDFAPGTILACSYLGREEPNGDERYPAAVFVLCYQSAAAGGSGIVAKLHVPVGEPPAEGWPSSVWAHGLGDPAADFHRWPFTSHNWRNTRGFLAGRWANHGIATLTPWLPGAGPSEPSATYSPLSLERNARAIVDGCAALEQFPQGSDLRELQPLSSPVGRLNLDRLVLRTDCVSTAVLVHLAAQWRSHAAMSGLRALVVDDFQPSYAYSRTYLGPKTWTLPGPAAAAVMSIWARVRWALAEAEGWPLSTFFTPRAIELLSPQVRLPVGERSRIYAMPLARFDRPSIAALLLESATADLGRVPDGRELRDWIFSSDEVRWMTIPTIPEMLRDPFYHRYCAGSDPYFAENIRPFSPGVPLLVVGRGDPLPLAGLPSLAERHQHMTLPRVRTLESWGWDVRLYESQTEDGTSFVAGPAQQWTLAELSRIL